MSPRIIIGIPSYNEEDSIAFVVKQIDEGIQKFYNPKEKARELVSLSPTFQNILLFFDGR